MQYAETLPCSNDLLLMEDPESGCFSGGATGLPSATHEDQNTGV